jgi:HD-like signal output (HDOD) protein
MAGYKPPISHFATPPMTPQFAAETAHQLIKGISIPPQPQIMVDLCMEMLLPDICLESISEIINKDVGLSGCILKAVNSNFFGLRNQITSINQALSLLGITNICNIVNALSIRSSLEDESIIELTQFWDNAVDVAMAAATISRLTGISSADEAYTLGLFHNCGIPLLMSKFDNYSSVLQNAYAEKKRRITDIENSLIDCNHAVIGYYVARAWKLPTYFCEAISDHHKTEAIFADKISCNPRKKSLLAVLKLAETSCKTHLTLGAINKDHEFARIKTDLLLYIGLSDYDFENLQSELIDMGLNKITTSLL